MTQPEFEFEFKRFVKIQGVKYDEDRIELMRWCYNRLRNLSIKTVAEILEEACKLTDYFPKINDIDKAIKNVLARGNSINNAKKISESWYDWIIKLPASEAKYYGHKLKEWQKENVKKKFGITEFLDIETASWWPKYYQAKNLLKNSFMNKAHDAIINIESEYDDSGSIDPRALALIGEQA
jgi:hypothetical protein